MRSFIKKILREEVNSERKRTLTTLNTVKKFLERIKVSDKVCKYFIMSLHKREETENTRVIVFVAPKYKYGAEMDRKKIKKQLQSVFPFVYMVDEWPVEGSSDCSVVNNAIKHLENTDFYKENDVLIFEPLNVEKKELDEKWSEKYKKSINCNNPKGFSQRAHCQGRKKKLNESKTEIDITKKQITGFKLLEAQLKTRYPFIEKVIPMIEDYKKYGVLLPISFEFSIIKFWKQYSKEMFEYIKNKTYLISVYEDSAPFLMRYINTGVDYNNFGSEFNKEVITFMNRLYERYPEKMRLNTFEYISEKDLNDIGVQISISDYQRWKEQNEPINLIIDSWIPKKGEIEKVLGIESEDINMLSESNSSGLKNYFFKIWSEQKSKKKIPLIPDLKKIGLTKKRKEIVGYYKEFIGDISLTDNFKKFLKDNIFDENEIKFGTEIEKIKIKLEKIDIEELDNGEINVYTNFKILDGKMLIDDSNRLHNFSSDDIPIDNFVEYFEFTDYLENLVEDFIVKESSNFGLKIYNITANVLRN